MSRKSPICTLNLSPGARLVPPPSAARVNASTKQRLDRSFALLQTLDSHHMAGLRSAIGKLIEQRVIWRELLDLELQEVDEQIERITAEVAGQL
jgi:hypothetical protein